MNPAAGHGSVFKPAFVLMSGRALGFIASFAIPLVLVRVFDPSGFGTYKQLFLIYATLYGIAQFGMAESLFYFLPTAHHLGGRYATNAMLVLLAAGGLGLGALWATSGAIGTGFNNPAIARYVPLIGLYLLLMLVSAPLEIVMTARRRHAYAFWTYAFTDVLRAGLCIVPALVFRRLDWVLYGVLACALLRLAATLTYLKREYGADLRPDWSLLAKQLAYAGPFALAVIIDMLQSNLHQYAVSYRFDAATFAVYSVGCLQIPLVDFMMTSTGNVLMVGMRESQQGEGSRAPLALWLDTTRRLALIFLPLVGGLLVTADDLILSLFTRNYSGSVPIFMVWSLSVPFSALLTDSVLRVYADTRYLIVVNTAKLALLAGLLVLLLPPLGMRGAVLAALLAIVFSKGLALGRVQGLLGVGIADLLPWRSLAATLVLVALAAVPALSMRALIATAGPMRLLVTGAIYAGACALLLLRFGPLRPVEKSEIRRWMEAPVVHVRDAMRHMFARPRTGPVA